MRPLGYSRSGIFLSELAAAGRPSVTVTCERCSHSRTIAIGDLIAQHGDIVMPDALGAITAGCPKRREIGVSYPRCSAVYADPATPEEMERIKAGRPQEPAQGQWRNRRPSE